MRLFSLVILFFCFTSLLRAQNSEWIQFKPEMCDFEAIFPETPTVRVDSMFAQTKFIYSYEYSSSSSDYVTYSVTCNDFPFSGNLDTKEKVMNMLKIGAERMFEEKPINMKEIHFNEYHGVSFVSKLGPVKAYYRSYLTNDRLYLIYVSGINHDAKKEAEKFFNNFKLK